MSLFGALSGMLVAGVGIAQEGGASPFFTVLLGPVKELTDSLPLEVLQNFQNFRSLPVLLFLRSSPT